MALNIPTKAGLDLLRRMKNAEAAAKYGLPSNATQEQLVAAHAAAYADRPGEEPPALLVKIYETSDEFRDEVIVAPLVAQLVEQRQAEVVNLLMVAMASDPQKMVKMLVIAGLDPALYI